MSETKNATQRRKRDNVYQTSDGRWRYRVMGTYADDSRVRISGCAPKDQNTKTAARQAMQAHLARMRFESPPPDTAPVDAAGKKEEPRNDNQAPGATAEGSASVTSPSLTVVTKRPIHTVNEFKAIYMAKCAADNKEITIETKEDAFVHICRLVGDTPVDGFDYATTESFRQALLRTRNGHVKCEERPISVTTVNNVLKVFRNMIYMAAEWHKFAPPKVPYAKRRNEEELDFDFLTFEEYARFIDAARWCRRHQTMVILAADTGMRRGELLGLHRDRIDLVNRSVYVCENYVKGRRGKGRTGLPKNGKPRTLPLTERATVALTEYLATHPHTRVFCNADGSPLDRDKIRGDLYKTCERAKLGRKFGWHVLRHTFASHLVMRGLPLKALQELLDHADIRTTMIYAHVAKGMARDAVKLLDARPTGPATEEDLAKVWQKTDATPLAV